MKKKILLGVLVPLTVVGITLGVSLQVTSCSCNNNDNQPLPTATLTIDSANFSKYLFGTSPEITGYTPEFTDFFNSHNVNKIVFDIDNIVIVGKTFRNCVALSNSSKQIPIEFTSASISIGGSAFDGCASISQIIMSSVPPPSIEFTNSNGSHTDAFANCTNLTGFSRGGKPSVVTITEIQDFTFDNCTNLVVNEIDDNILAINGCTWVPGTGAHISDSGYWMKDIVSSYLYGAGCLAVGSIICPLTTFSPSAFMYFGSLTEIDGLPPLTTLATGIFLIVLI